MHPSQIDVHSGLSQTGSDELVWLYGGRELVITTVSGTIKSRNLLPEPTEDFHGITIYDGICYVANTIYSLIHGIDMATGEIKSVYRFGPQADKIYDAVHINSVSVNNKMLYATSFDYRLNLGSMYKDGKVKELWRENRSGVLLFWPLDRPDFYAEIELEGLDLPHSLWMNGDHGMLCNSGSRSIAYLERKENKWQISKIMVIERAFSEKRFLRGLSVDESGFYVGLSAWRDDKKTVDNSIIARFSHCGKLENEWFLPIGELFDIIEAI